MVATLSRPRLLLVAVAFALVAALGMALAPSAHANDRAMSRIVNDTSFNLGAQFHTLSNTTVYMLVGAHNWQGETSGNMYDEPRTIYAGPGWCVNYYFWLYGAPGGGPTYRACGGSSGNYTSIYMGDGNTRGYDVHLTAAYPGP